MWTLYEGDCLEMMKGIPDGSIDAVVTDPPYFLPVQSYVGTRKDSYAKRTLADTSILRGYFDVVFKELARMLKQTGTFYVFCDAQSYPIFYQVMYPYCKHVRLLIWDKIVSYNGYTWRHQHELIAWGELQETNRIPTGDGDILKCRGVLQKNRLHPAEKPIEIMKKLIEKSTNEGDTIIDPFSGSGSSLVGAESLNRNSIGIELNPEYCNIIRERMGEIQARLF